jgi:sigma-E factor negative regulatory protein RseB
MRRGIILAVLSIPFFTEALFAAGDNNNSEQANRILKRMSVAVRELNYHGLFTYEVGGSLDTYKIVHRVEDDTEYERLQKLNGPEREILRAGHMIDCLSRGDQLLRGLWRSASDLRDNYHFYLTGDERVADRLAVIVRIVPKDQHRFGYTLAIDKQSGLPLKAMRVSTKKRVMERIQFVELSVGEVIEEEEVKPSSQQKWQAAHDLMDCESELGAGEPAWKVNWLPDGFVYSGQRTIPNGDYVLTYTDGLATFSVFIGQARKRPAIEGRAQIGATVAYVNQRIWSQQPHSVTVVGEVPFATAQRVVAGLEPANGLEQHERTAQ